METLNSETDSLTRILSMMHKEEEGEPTSVCILSIYISTPTITNTPLLTSDDAYRRRWKDLLPPLLPKDISIGKEVAEWAFFFLSCYLFSTPLQTNISIGVEEVKGLLVPPPLPPPPPHSATHIFLLIYCNPRQSRRQGDRIFLGGRGRGVLVMLKLP